jgi:amino-acid N-acetyltransferase
MSLAAASPADAPAIRALLEASGLPAADLSPALLEGFLVRRDGAALVATGGLEWAGEDALLRSVAVAAAARGAGVGAVMVAALEIRARQRGARALYLLTATAEHWFAGLGYRVLPRQLAPDGIRATAQFAGLCPSSSVFMSKALEL